MNDNNELKSSFKAQIDRLQQDTTTLKSQMMTNSLIDELTKVMHSKTTPESIIKTIMLGINEIASFDRVILFEIDKKSFCLKPQAWFGIDESIQKEYTIPLGFEGGEITDAIFLNRHLVVEEVFPEEDFFYKTFNSNSYLVIPLIGRVLATQWTPGKLKGKFEDTQETISENERRKNLVQSKDFQTIGVFWIDRKQTKAPVTSEDISTLLSIINQSAIILDNLSMFTALEQANVDLQKANKKQRIVNRELRNANAKINRDLQHARSIQQGLLPLHIPDTPELSIRASYIPADAVGGDYYDVFEIAPGVYGIIVADVSGHGVSSALIMSMVKVLLKSLVNTEDGPQKTLEKINDIFMNEITTDNFITVFYATLDTNAHVMHFTSAGHCPIFFFDKSNKTCEKVKADGLFLGVFPDMMLKESDYPYKPGNMRLILYTDGLTEARNRKGDMYDIDRLEQISMETLDNTTVETNKMILESQRKFCGKVRASDDITLLVIDF